MVERLSTARGKRGYGPRLKEMGQLEVELREEIGCWFNGQNAQMLKMEVRCTNLKQI
jgi:hypothetical protein